MQGLVSPIKEFIKDNESYDFLSMVSGTALALSIDSLI